VIGGIGLALEAAEHYRALRRLGVTARRTIDLLIRGPRIANGCALLHRDRNFDPLAQHPGLGSL
jgi:predicted nucleic acid-binding protein